MADVVRARRQVTGHGQGFRRRGTQADVATPAGEEPPLRGVDAPSVVGEDGLQGVGHALVGGTQSRQGRGFLGGRSGCWRRWS